MLRTWFSTVFAAIESSRPISSLEWPRDELEHLSFARRQRAGCASGGPGQSCELSEDERGERALVLKVDVTRGPLVDSRDDVSWTTARWGAT
jgi:hypothetical protein